MASKTGKNKPSFKNKLQKKAYNFWNISIQVAQYMKSYLIFKGYSNLQLLLYQHSAKFGARQNLALEK